MVLNCFDQGQSCEIYFQPSGYAYLMNSSTSTFFSYPDLPDIGNPTDETTSPDVRLVTTDSFARWNSTAVTMVGFVNGTKGIGPKELYMPQSVAFDQNQFIYIADSWNNRIQRIDLKFNNGTPVAGIGDGSSGASTTAICIPMGIVLDSARNMYFTDRFNHRLMFWPHGASSGIIQAGTTGVSGNASNQFFYPSGLIRLTTTGVLYIADTENHRIMAYQSNASSGTVVAGGNGAGTGYTQLHSPYTLAFDESANSLIIANTNAHTIVRWALGSSTWTLVAGVVGAAGSTSTTLNGPIGIVLDPLRNLYVADTNNHRIQLFLADQSQGITIAGVTGYSGISATELFFPYGVSIDTNLNLYVTDTYNHRIQRFSRLY